MPAVLQQWIEKSEERNRRIQQLRNEVTEIMELNVMDVTYRMLVEFLADEGIEHISEMDYILRKNYEVYMSELVKGNIVSRYLRIFDKVKQEYIRKRMETPMGRMECQWTYKNAILFIPYHSDQKIVQSVERVKNRSNMVWNFQIDSSEKMKRQIFDVLEFILENYEPSRVREQKLTGLHIFYEFCRLRKIEDINCLEQVQEEDFQIFLERKIENEQRRNRLRSIVGFVCRITFLQAKEIRWDATIWYLEKFKIPKERLNPSDPVERISFREVLHPENRKLLPIIIRSNPIVNHKTINFRKIEQPDIREEMKKAIYYHLQYEAIATVTREVSVMNKFSKYLKEKYPQVDSCEEIDRNIIEKFLIYLKIEVESGNGKRDDLIKLRDVLETVGKIYGWEQLGRLFIKSDFPPERRGEFRYYSDSELKRLNAHIVKLEEQIARALIIHQLLGNRISDTLTMRKDCLYRRDNQDMVIIYQPKSRRFEKPVSAEVAQLTKKAIVYAEQNYKESIYIFANKDNPQKPLNYQTLREKVIRMIYENDLRDDQGELFGFGSHLFRHTYGVKLTELHVDDWTISKLIGHKNVKTVKYYRKMSNQSMADETREARNYMSNVILANLDGWGEEYEQIRQNARIK